MSSERVVIFSKSADEENVKTRLRSVLDSKSCLALHLAMLKDTLEKVQNFSAVLYLSGSGSLPFQPGIPVHFQQGENLGSRMIHAFKSELSRNSKVVIIGIDSPTLPESSLTRALAGLDHHDVVLGPSVDGGYYLIGLRKMVTSIFEGISWGTEKVLQQTIERIGPSSYLLLEKFADVDVPQDLIRLRNEIEQSSLSLKHVRNWINDYFGKNPGASELLHERL